jgi:hypothetical protein
VRIVRVKTQWSNEGRDVSAEDVVGVLAFNAWRIGMQSMLEIEEERFDVDRQIQRIMIISEVMHLLVHSLDRILYKTVNDDDREFLITTFARKLSDHVHENARGFEGPGDYRTPFLNTLNIRLASYSDTKWDDERHVPAFSMAREFGANVVSQLGDKDREWALDYIQQVLTPEIMETFNKILIKTGLLDKVVKD